MGGRYSSSIVFIILKILFDIDGMRIFFSSDHSRRDAKTELYGGELRTPFESPARAEIVLAACREHEVGEICQAHRFDESIPASIHDAGYVEFLRNCALQWEAAGFKGEAIASIYPTRRLWNDRVPDHIDGKLGYYALASETSITHGTWEAALASKNVALSAALSLSSDQSIAFGLCRPPGHHAARDQFGGYCFLNNAALAAQALRDAGQPRVAILDVDFHHGNGTQDIFYGRDDVLFVSLHGEPANTFPYFLGYEDEKGSGAGEGYNINLPLPEGTTYSVFKPALLLALQRISDFAPSTLIVSLGLDTYYEDPISNFKLTTQDFWNSGREISSLQLPIAVLLEGGYATEALGLNAVSFLQGLRGIELA